MTAPVSRLALPPSPPRIPAGARLPAYGRYAGLADAIDWTGLDAVRARNAWWRRVHAKRWHYVGLASPSLFAAVAIVDLGWVATAFAYAFDRRARRVVAEHARDGLPSLHARVGSDARSACSFRFGRDRIALSRSGDAMTLKLDCPGLHIDAVLHDTAPERWLLAVGPIDGGAAHATQKSGGLACSGTLVAGGRSHDLQDCIGSIDYSNGVLARETRWRWASAHSGDLGFNLQQGYFGSCENALWIDGRIVPVGPASFVYDAARPEDPWRITTDDGLIDLHFSPEGSRRQDKNLLVAASRYVQPVGTYAGWVRASPESPRREVSGLAGVAEDHFSRW